MSVLWGLFSCCGGGLALFALVGGLFVVKHRVGEWRDWRRWRRRAPALLEDPRPPVPVELGAGRAERNWSGGYLDGGSEELRERAQRLLRQGVVRQARVIEADHQGDADDWAGYVVYAFRQLDGSVAVERAASSVNPWGAAISQGAGDQATAFDIMEVATGAGWLHVLLDPETGEHLIYESLLVGRRPPRTGPPPVSPQVSAAPPNLHVSAPTAQLTPLTPLDATHGGSEQQLLREALALFPTLPANEDDGDRRVVADLLAERGFVRGELIALQTAAAPTPAHHARIAELLRTYAVAWLPPGVHPRRFEFRRGFAWSVTLEQSTNLQHLEWPFIRHVAVASPGGPGLFDGFEHLTLSSLTGLGPQALWYLLRGRLPRGLQHLEFAMSPQELLPYAERLRALTPVELISLRARRQHLTTATLVSMLDALPTPSRVRLALQWGDVRGFQREVARRPWLRALELVSLESTASTLALEITAGELRVVTAGRHDAAAWNALSAALRAQGFTSIPVFVSETGARREQPLD